MGNLLLGLMAASYPIAVYLGADQVGLGTLAGLLAAALLCRLFLLPVGMGIKVLGSFAVLLVGVLWFYQDDDRWLILHPVLLNSGLLIVFGGSLLHGMPMIERIARWRDMPVGDHNLGYLRGLTSVWALFFALCAVVSLYTVWNGDRALWALWNGFLVYVAMGVLTLVELVYRRRFKLRLHREGRLPESERASIGK
jgi:uncharacterized membrane protein